MKRLLLLTSALLLIHLGGQAQAKFPWHKFGASIGYGSAYYVGDLKANFLPNPKYMRQFCQYQLRFQATNYLTIIGGYMTGNLQGADAWNRKAPDRDFWFKSYVKDYHLWVKQSLPYWDDYFLFAPGLVFGASYFKFDPQIFNGAAWAPAKGIGTEGQNLGGAKPYKLWSIAIDIGPEITIPIFCWLDLDLYVIYSKTFTDHLDDVGGEYPAANRLLETPGGLTTLSYAYRWRDGSPNNFNSRGLTRGNPGWNDGYIRMGANLTFWPFRCNKYLNGAIPCPDKRKFNNPLDEMRRKKDKKKKPDPGELK